MEAAVRWSPHSTGDRWRFLIVNVSDSSLTLNEVDDDGRGDVQYHPVSRFTKFPGFGAFAWSPVQESIVALGLLSGNASLIRLGEDKQRSETIATFKVKQQRKCNSVALSSQNWLAVALDKTRSDVCLSIYDTNGDLSGTPEPVRRLCAAELVSSVRFFPNSPHELVATTQRSFIRIYDLRDGYFGAGGSGSLQASTRNVNNIAIDPLNDAYFASAGSTGNPSFTVWDKRWMTQSPSAGSNNGAVFNTTLAPEAGNTHPTTIRSLRWSGERRGRLALCTSSDEVRFIDMKEAQSSVRRQSEYLPANPYGGAPWQSNRYVAQTRSLGSPWNDTESTGGTDSQIIAFDWVVGPNLDVNASQQMIVLRPDREVRLLSVPNFNVQAEITAREDLAVTSGSTSIVEAADLRTKRISGAESAEDFGPHYDPNDGDDEAVHIRDLSSPDLSRLLSSATLQRERCRQGYLFDCRKNASIVSGDWQLERLWEIVRRFRDQSANDGMLYASLDVSYIGVSGLWSEKFGNAARRSTSPSRSVPAAADTIVGLTTSKAIPAFVGARTNFPEHRQLCLAVCGWKFTTETLEAECQELIERGLHYQAIVQAVLHEYKHIALNLLRTLIRGKMISNIGLGALLASDEINDEQREMCLWMAADTEDLALKALLTFLTTGNWRDVMKTNYLHLGYRVALGLKYLNDTELSGFLQSETARAIKNGDLEGVLLTGLSEQAMDMFQTYITRTSDLQTAVLAMGVTNPRFVDDVRWGMWEETYFEQMQAWRAFNERTKFAVLHNRMAKARDGSSMIERPKARVTLRCNHCQAPLGHRRPQASAVNGHAGSNGTTNTKIAGPAAHAGTVCRTCGRHMPRCAICMLWLGTPATASPANKNRNAGGVEDGMSGMLAFCVACGHGYHADHAREWFKTQGGRCAAPGCLCMCGLGW